MLCIVSETTERVRAARVLAEERRLYAMFEQAPSFMAMLRELDHVFEFTNVAYQQLIGHRPVIGLPVARALPELVEQGFVNLLDDAAASRAQRADGAPAPARRRHRAAPDRLRLPADPGRDGRGHRHLRGRQRRHRAARERAALPQPRRFSARAHLDVRRGRRADLRQPLARGGVRPVGGRHPRRRLARGDPSRTISRDSAPTSTGRSSPALPSAATCA